MIKVIASDLDGTLMPDGAIHLPPHILPLISRLIEKGILFVAASGRDYQNERVLFEPIKDDIAYIGSNGAVCHYRNQCIFQAALRPELQQKLLQELEQAPDFGVFLVADDYSYMKADIARYLTAYSDTIKMKVVDNLSEVTVPLRKISAFHLEEDEEKTLAFLTHLKNLFSPEIRIVTSGTAWIDCMAADANKGSALQHLLKHLDVRPEECLAFGDQYNDIEMLRYAGTSYAMKTAAPDVIAAADAVTDSVETILKELLQTLD